MNETQASAITPKMLDTSANVPRAGILPIRRGTARGGPAKIDPGVNGVKRSDSLIERLRSFNRSFNEQAKLMKKPLASSDLSTKLSAPTGLFSTSQRSATARPVAGDLLPRLPRPSSLVSRQILDETNRSRLMVADTRVGRGGLVAMAEASQSNVVKSVFPLGPPEQVTGAQLTRYARLIYDKTGIRVSPQKRMLLSNRLRRRMRQTGIEDFDAYYRYLTGLQDRHPEWNEFFQEITTHETYFFRDENQWDWFTNIFLEEHIHAAASVKRPRRLRIWSAACSTGDEAYTIACCAAATLPSELLSKVDILGSDIAAGEIRRAEKPAYGQRAMRLVPEDYLHLFHKDDEGDWVPKPILRQMVRFCAHNLMARLGERPFDLVFLKNVLIYFDKSSKKRVLDNVCPLVRPGGLLVVGAAEGVASMISGFKRIEPWLFQRQSGERE